MRKNSRGSKELTRHSFVIFWLRLVQETLLLNLDTFFHIRSEYKDINLYYLYLYIITFYHAIHRAKQSNEHSFCFMLKILLCSMFFAVTYFLVFMLLGRYFVDVYTVDICVFTVEFTKKNLIVMFRQKRVLMLIHYDNN